jgi:flavin reductase (DIM6/NTAB) family NADH-FMN oxidoreductase RutF
MVSKVDGDAYTRAFRDCVGTFATGVTVVAVEHEGDRAGMTLNSFTSVSLDPLIVCVSLAHGTRTHELIGAAGRFTVSILRAGQEEVALAFAEPGSPFPHGLVGDDARVEGALAVLHCAVRDRFGAGDHDLVLGLVEGFDAAAGDPLVFHRGSFGALDRGAQGEYAGGGKR